MFSLFKNLKGWKKAVFITILLLVLVAMIGYITRPRTYLATLNRRLFWSREDTGKVNLLNDFAFYYVGSDIQKALMYGKRAMQLSKKLGWVKGEVMANFSLGFSYEISGDNQEALRLLHRGYELAKKNKLSDLQHQLELQLGYVCMIMNSYDQAIIYLKTATGNYLQTKELDNESWFTRYAWWYPAINLGNIYYKTKQDSTAFTYYQQILDTCKKEKDSLGIRTALNLFIRYNNDYKQDYGQSVKYGFEELKYFRKGDTSSACASVITYIANGYRLQKNYVKALQYYREAIALKPEANINIRNSANSGMREIYSMLEDHDKALGLDMEQLRDAQLIGDTGVQEIRLHERIADDYVGLKQYNQALLHLNKAMEINREWKEPQTNSRLLGSLADVYYLTHRYDEALHTVQESLRIKEKEEYFMYVNLLLQAIIIRDAPDAVLQKYGVPPAERYTLAIKDLLRSLDFFQTFHSVGYPEFCYKELSTAYEKTGDYDRFHDTYKRYIALRDSSVNRQNQNAFISKVADIQFEKREDSLKYLHHITNAKLQEQTLLITQQRRYYTSGIVALLIISFFIARNYYNQRRSNKLISAGKKRSDDLLLNILPADVAEELKEKGSADARLFEEVTVLFTDFVNFTAVGELLTPQELVDELHACFKAFDEIISRHSIEKIKTIGDAYLAVAGLPHADAHHAYNTVKAALEIRQFIHDRKELKGSHSFDIRIGIHSGSVVAGIVGVKKFAYDIWGDTVNTAARMEQNSLPGRINLSEKTYGLVKDRFAFTYRGEIDAKNKGAMKMYFVEMQRELSKVDI